MFELLGITGDVGVCYWYDALGGWLGQFPLMLMEMIINYPYISAKMDAIVYQMLNVPVSQTQMWSSNI